MTLFLFVLGLFIIFVISRYNESNKLFWSLLTCYLLAFAVKVVYDRYTTNEGSDVKLTQAYPTQGLPAMSGTTQFFVTDMDLVAKVDASPKPVSQVITPDVCEFCITSSVCGVTHEQYFYNLSNPPNDVEIVDDS